MHKTTKNRHANHSQYDLHDDMAKIRAILSETASDVKGRAGEVFSQSFENAKGKTQKYKKTVGDYAQEKPLQALGISFAIGVFVGFFLLK